MDVNRILTTVIFVVLLYGGADAQYSYCPDPPCGPGLFLGNDEHGTALIMCKGMNQYPCVTNVGASRLEIGESGVLELNGEEGRATETYTYTNYRGQIERDGNVILQFENLELQ